jgi:A/G-specific adenine glycosylase
MLQQTQVAAVVPYYVRFVAAFPELHALAAAPLERVLELWSGLGYYSRARNLHRCAIEIVAQHGGEFPRHPERVAELPGLGRSTAAAICAFAFGFRAPILDGNVKRVLARHAGVGGYPGERTVEAALWSLATERMADAAQPDVEAYTQGVMDLGATICVRSRPLGAACPVADDCVARATGRTHELPAPRPKKPLPQRAVTMLLALRHDAVLVERRPATGIWGGLWSLPELPEATTADAYCLARFGAGVDVEHPLPPIEHGFTHFRLTITPQPVRIVRWDEAAGEPGTLWLPLAEVGAAALPAPIKKLLLALAGRTSGQRNRTFELQLQPQ